MTRSPASPPRGSQGGRLSGLGHTLKASVLLESVSASANEPEDCSIWVVVWPRVAWRATPGGVDGAPGLIRPQPNSGPMRPAALHRPRLRNSWPSCPRSRSSTNGSGEPTGRRSMGRAARRGRDSPGAIVGDLSATPECGGVSCRRPRALTVHLAYPLALRKRCARRTCWSDRSRRSGGEPR